MRVTRVATRGDHIKDRGLKAVRDVLTLAELKLEVKVLATLWVCGLVAIVAAQPNPLTCGRRPHRIAVDVRTAESYCNDGHADCSVNVPLAAFLATESLPEVSSLP